MTVEYVISFVIVALMSSRVNIVARDLKALQQDFSQDRTLRNDSRKDFSQDRPLRNDNTVGHIESVRTKYPLTENGLC